jgi:hypothetical protein
MAEDDNTRRLIAHHARQEISDAARGTDALGAANSSALPGGEDRLALRHVALQQ